MPSGAQQYEHKFVRQNNNQKDSEKILNIFKNGSDTSEIFYKKILAKNVWSEQGGITGSLEYLIKLIEDVDSDNKMEEIIISLSDLKDDLEKNKIVDLTTIKNFLEHKYKLKSVIGKLDQQSSSCTDDQKNVLHLLQSLFAFRGILDKRTDYYYEKFKEGKEPPKKEYYWDKLFSKNNIKKDYKYFKQIDRDREKSKILQNDESSEDEKKVVKHYTFKGYLAYNKIARGKITGNAEDIKGVNTLSEFINKHPMEKGGTYYRGMGSTEVLKFLLSDEDKKDFEQCNKNNATDIAAYIDSIKGHYLVDKGFSSTSENKRIAGFRFGGLLGEPSVFMKINIKPGVPALPILENSRMRSEEEVLLNKGTRLKIESAKVNSMNTVTIHVTAEAPT